MVKAINIMGPTAGGGFNVIGMEDGQFILQGNLTIAQLKELKKEINDCLKANKS